MTHWLSHSLVTRRFYGLATDRRVWFSCQQSKGLLAVLTSDRRDSVYQSDIYSPYHAAADPQLVWRRYISSIGLSWKISCSSQVNNAIAYRPTATQAAASQHIVTDISCESSVLVNTGLYARSVWKFSRATFFNVSAAAGLISVRVFFPKIFQSTTRTADCTRYRHNEPV